MREMQPASPPVQIRGFDLGVSKFESIREQTQRSVVANTDMSDQAYQAAAVWPSGGALPPSALDYPAGDRANRFIVLGAVARGIAQMVETAFKKVQRAGVLRLDIFDQLEQQMFGRDLAPPRLHSVGVCHKRLASNLRKSGCTKHTVRASAAFTQTRWRCLPTPSAIRRPRLPSPV
ncbi:hypothetical protein [Sphingomonas sp. NBWT7]|uniref:hypothetical protein n=1 Tax=Sphingomonas sp. NBWT7 TaxID=2596913 RepID=UPI001CA49A14|nr:hypothetical protein [Sphingomonas sp. NBWT7]